MLSNETTTQVVPQSEPFVDLYQLLEVPAQSDAPSLRKRIMSLYAVAQENLEHRNFRKRFYYQELFEVHLPRAHKLLLHEARRAAYDQELEAHYKFQNTGEYANAEARLDSPHAKGHSAPPTANNGTSDDLMIDATTSLSIARPPTPDSMRMDAARVERRRDAKRRALIQKELESAGVLGGLAGGLLTTFAGGAILFFVLDKLPGGAANPLGWPRDIFNFFCFLVMLVCGVLVAHFALRHVRRTIVATLSQMPYDQLHVAAGVVDFRATAFRVLEYTFLMRVFPILISGFYLWPRAADMPGVKTHSPIFQSALDLR